MRKQRRKSPVEQRIEAEWEALRALGCDEIGISVTDDHPARGPELLRVHIVVHVKNCPAHAASHTQNLSRQEKVVHLAAEEDVEGAMARLRQGIALLEGVLAQAPDDAEHRDLDDHPSVVDVDEGRSWTLVFRRPF